MAFAFFRLAPRYHISGTQSATQAIDYLTRTGQQRFRARAADLLHVETFRLPGWSRGDVRIFFKASEAYEAARGDRRKGVWAIGMKCALPREVDASQYLPMARQFLEEACGDKAGFWVLHDQTASDGFPNVHIHILISARKLFDGRTPDLQTFFADPRRGGHWKDTRLMKRATAWHLRCLWIDITNAAYREAGLGIQLPYAWSRRQQVRALQREDAALEAQQLRLQRDLLALRNQARQHERTHDHERTRKHERGYDRGR